MSTVMGTERLRDPMGTERLRDPMGTERLRDPQLTTANSHTQRPYVRLTRRGKVVVIAASLIIIGLVALLLASAVTATDAAGPTQDVRVVTVEADQTLWQIAAAANPQGDIRDTVDEIVRLNSLASTAVDPGTQLSIPGHSR